MNSGNRTVRIGSIAAWAAAAVLLCLPERGAEALDSSTYTYPLRPGAGGRIMEDQEGKPFLIHGEAAWSLIVQLTADEVETYMENRRLKEVNTLLVNLIEHLFCDDPPNNADGQGPFTSPGDFSTPNDAYFDHAEWVIERAADKGILVLLTPCYLGYNGGDEGWWSEASSNTTAACRGYGRYLGARFVDDDNVIWVQGGDYTAPVGTAGEACALEIMYGIQDEDPSKLHTGHWSRGTQSLDQTSFASSMDLNGVYTGGNTYVDCLDAWGRDDFMPAYLFETYYEGEHGLVPHEIRSYAYWADLSCVGGQLFGNRPIWLFDDGWEAAMESQGSLDMERLGSLFLGLAWHTLAPDADHAVVTDGTGTFGGEDYVTAAASPDGTLVVAYLPSTGTEERTVTVDMGRMSGPASARWYNPVDGTSRDAADGEVPNSGSRDFTSPGDNGSGTNDWVLVLETSPGPGDDDALERVPDGVEPDADAAPDSAADPDAVSDMTPPDASADMTGEGEGEGGGDSGCGCTVAH